MALTFTDRQARTIAAAVTTVSAVVLLTAVGLVGWMAAVFLRTFAGVFLPLAVGAVAALVCRPYYEWLHRTQGLPAAPAVAVVFLSAVVPLAIVTIIFGQLIVTQLIELASQVPGWWQAGRAWVVQQVPRATELLEQSGLGERLSQTLTDQQASILAGLQALGAQALSAGLGLARGVGALLSWLVTPVYFTYFLTTSGGAFNTDKLLPFLKPATRDDVGYLIQEFLDILVGFFRGQMVIALLQGVLFAVGFSLVGLSYGFVVGITLGVLNVVPYLGNIIGLAVAIPLALFQPDGGWVTCLLVLGVFVVVQQIEGWFLTPKIMGDRTGLHFMAIIVAVFFWGTALGGILGMILAIPLTAFLASLWHLGREKYIPEIL